MNAFHKNEYLISVVSYFKIVQPCVMPADFAASSWVLSQRSTLGILKMLIDQMQTESEKLSVESCRISQQLTVGEAQASKGWGQNQNISSNLFSNIMY